MNAIVDYLKANAISDWGVVSVKQVMKDTLCDTTELDQTLAELHDKGWQFIYSVVAIGGVDYKMIEFEIN